MSFDLERHAPPGFPVQRERRFFLLCYGLSLVWSAGGWLLRYTSARNALYQYIGRTKILAPGALMAPFGELLHRSFTGFALLAFVLAGAVLVHYSYYYKDAKPIYLMRRLPDRGLLHRQCWTLPLLGLALCAVTVLVLLGLYALIYHVFTPAECLPATVWGLTILGGKPL